MITICGIGVDYMELRPESYKGLTITKVKSVCDKDKFKENLSNAIIQMEVISRSKKKFNQSINVYTGEGIDIDYIEVQKKLDELRTSGECDEVIFLNSLNRYESEMDSFKYYIDPYTLYNNIKWVNISSIINKF